MADEKQEAVNDLFKGVKLPDAPGVFVLDEDEEVEDTVEAEEGEEDRITDEPVVEDEIVETPAEEEDVTEAPEIVEEEKPVVEATPEVVEKKAAEPAKIKFKSKLQAATYNYLNSEGEPDMDAFREMTRDYSKLSPQETIIAKIKSDPDNMELGPRAFNRVVEEALSKYSLDDDDDEEREIGEELLKRDAVKIQREMASSRDAVIEKYAEGVEIGIQEQEPTGPTKEEIQQRRDAKVSFIEGGINEMKEAKLLDAEGRFTIKDKAGDINVSVTEKDVFDFADDSENFLRQFFDQKTNAVNWNGLAEMVAFAKNPEKYRSEMIAFGQSQKQNKLVEEFKNPATKKNGAIVNPRSGGRDPMESPLEFLKGAKVMKGARM
jgi:hypothetical protein